MYRVRHALPGMSLEEDRVRRFPRATDLSNGAQSDLLWERWHLEYEGCAVIDQWWEGGTVIVHAIAEIMRDEARQTSCSWQKHKTFGLEGKEDVREVPMGWRHKMWWEKSGRRPLQ